MFSAVMSLISCPASAETEGGFASTRGSVKLSLGNEVIRDLPFERQCALAAGLGYRGLELAPFTFGDDAWRMPAAKRIEIRRTCGDAGLG